MLNVSLLIPFYDFLHIIIDEWALAVVEGDACQRLYDECCVWVSHLSKELLDSKC